MRVFYWVLGMLWFLVLSGIILMACASVPVGDDKVTVFGNTTMVIYLPETGQVYYVRTGNQDLTDVQVARAADKMVTVTFGSAKSNSDAIEAAINTIPKAVVDALKKKTNPIPGL